MHFQVIIMKTIFIVDDSDAYLLLAKNALEGLYETYALPSAARMFKIAEKIKADLILLDVEMPEMDGFTALENLKKNDSLKDIPVIFLTGKDEPESEKKGLEMGAVDFVRKPFSPPDLIDRIKKYI